MIWCVDFLWKVKHMDSTQQMSAMMPLCRSDSYITGRNVSRSLLFCLCGHYWVALYELQPLRWVTSCTYTVFYHRLCVLGRKEGRKQHKGINICLYKWCLCTWIKVFTEMFWCQEPMSTATTECELSPAWAERDPLVKVEPSADNRCIRLLKCPLSLLFTHT